MGRSWGPCQPCCYLWPSLGPLWGGPGLEAPTCCEGRSRWPLVCDHVCAPVEQMEEMGQVEAMSNRRLHVNYHATACGDPHSTL